MFHQVWWQSVKALFFSQVFSNHCLDYNENVWNESALQQKLFCLLLHVKDLIGLGSRETAIGESVKHQEPQAMKIKV